jgi:hypothetical protein
MSKNLDTAIMAIHELDNAELDKVIAHIKTRRAHLSAEAKYKFKTNDLVVFTSRGITYRGRVINIFVKRASVKTDAGLYRVPLNMLSKAA